jgi:hypothetical protein
MPAAVNADDITKPLDDDVVDYPASMGAAEFRALKAKLNNMFLLTGVDQEPDASKLITLNGRGLYANFTDNPSSDVKILYGFASNVRRSGHDNHTVGGQFSAYLENNLTLSVGQTFGVVANAIAGATNSISGLVGIEVSAIQQNNNNNSNSVGIDIVFADRIGAAAAPGGLGSNKYNNKSVAVNISSQTRSTSGEFCGWNTGIKFNEYCMDLAVNGGTQRGYAIDFFPLHYDGGLDPATAFRVDAVIRMRTLQTLLWDDNAGGKTRVGFLYPGGVAKFCITQNGVERWSVDVNTGQVYKNGILQY